MIYRPTRERNVEDLKASAREMLQNTGHDSWKSEHEVKLYLIPSTFECFTCTMKNILFSQTFVHHITQDAGSLLPVRK